MDSRPLPGELVASLPRGTDPSRVSHHIPLRGGPDGLLGETHLLVHDGELHVVTRASARDPFRALDLHPVERAMLLAEGWGVQLKLPLRRGTPCALEIPSRDVATVLALLAALRPLARSSEPAPEATISAGAPDHPTQAEPPPPAPSTTITRAEAAPRPTASEETEATTSRTQPELTEAFRRGQPPSRPAESPIERESPLRPAPFFRDVEGAPERRSNLRTDDLDDLDDLFAEHEAIGRAGDLAEHRNIEVFAERSDLEIPAEHGNTEISAERGDLEIPAEPGSVPSTADLDAATLRERFQRAADEHRQQFVASAAARPSVLAGNTSPSQHEPSPLRFRFDLDDLPPPAPQPPLDAPPERATTNHTLAEFFDAHVQLPAEDPPRRAMPAPPMPPVDAAEPVKHPEATPSAMETRASLARLAAERVAALHTPSPSPLPNPPAATPRAITEPIATITDDATLPPGVEPPTLDPAPRPNRRLISPRLAAASAHAASAAASSASAAASAASHAFGKARLAASRYLDRRRTRQSGRRRNRRRGGAPLSPRVIAFATAALLLPVLIYIAWPSSDPQPQPTPVAAETTTTQPQQPITAELPSDAPPPHTEDLVAATTPPPPERAREPSPAPTPSPAATRDFLGVATLTSASPRPEDLALRECRALAPRGLRVRVKVEINEPTGAVVEVYVGDSTIERELRSCIARQFKKASFEPKRRGGKLIKPRLTLQF